MRVGIIGAGPVGMALAAAVKRAGKAELVWYVRNSLLRSELESGGLQVTIQPKLETTDITQFRPADPDNIPEQDLIPALSASDALMSLKETSPLYVVEFEEGEIVGAADSLVKSAPDIVLSCTKADALLPLRRALAPRLGGLLFFITNGFWLHPGIDIGVMFGGGYNEGTHVSLIPEGRLILGRTKSPNAEFLTFRTPDDNKGTLIFRHEELETMESLAKVMDPGIVQVITQPDIYPVMARKAALNCLLNPLAAITGQANGVLLLEEALPIVEKLSEEIVEVMTQAMIMPPFPNDFTANHLLSDFRVLSNSAGQNRGSLLLDRLRGRRGEISYLNGLLLVIAERYGLEMPVNATIISLLQCPIVSAA